MSRVIECRLVDSTSDHGRWVRFPYRLYQGDPYYVPDLLRDEMKYWMTGHNPVFRHARCARWLAWQDGKVLGRVAAMINDRDILENGERRLRWGYLDAVDDPQVFRLLLDCCARWGREQDMQYMEGPMGMTNLDKAGLLIEGYQELDNITTWYHAPYYKEHIETYGLTAHQDYVEYEIEVPSEIPERVKRFSRSIAERAKVRRVENKQPDVILHYAREVFRLMNKTHRELHGFIPFEDDLIEHYAVRYAKFIQPDFCSIIIDEQDELVAFGIALPSFSRAFQKSGGKLFPLGWYYIRKALKKNNRADLLLIGVDPERQNRGIPALIFEEIMEGFMKHGIERVESNPELADNHEVQRLWSRYTHRLHKKRRTYRMSL